MGLCRNFVSGVTSAVGDEIALEIDLFLDLDGRVYVRTHRANLALPTRFGDGGPGQDQDHEGGEKEGIEREKRRDVIRIMGVAVVVIAAESQPVTLRSDVTVLLDQVMLSRSGMTMDMAWEVRVGIKTEIGRQRARRG
ncbi:hypothetical protein PV11_01924 [Exophiala sideris]|uniref:Uncharacterized protein n=1 Tax=Exophiala sideris TaxID=1016849 RepID=A0A0D1XE42_9EURO|nr:hypothetical protein PV11_01924 [Exophiala sideris]